MLHRPPAASFAELVPYAFGPVDLEEGVRVVIVIIAAGAEARRAQMAVDAAIDRPPRTAHRCSPSRRLPDRSVDSPVASPLLSNTTW